MQDILNKGRAEVVVAVAGEEESYVLARETGEINRVPIINIGRNVVDTNGAGDSFVAEFLYGYFNKYNYLDCAILGNIAGAYGVSCEGNHEDFIINDTLLTNFKKYKDQIIK
jgi:acarbose 7IV-phosphotransferase